MMNKFLKIFLKTSFLYPLLISPFLILLYKIYLRKVSAFGCFDDCFNIVAGYFLSQDKILYKDFFFNHQPLMAYISFGIQTITDPINIFALILAHRKFILIFSILMNLLIVARFRLAAIGFVLFYETTKFYVFGDRFLAEAIIVYPLVYMLGLVWYKFNNRKIFKAEYILSAFFVWFIIFLREPFVLLSIFLFVIIIGFRFTRVKIASVIFFTLLSFVFLLKLPLSDYIFNVVSMNKDIVMTKGSLLWDFFKIFFYPLYVFLEGENGFFRNILMALSILFLFFAGVITIKMKKRKVIALIIFILGLANIRYVNPGHAFYQAFHMAPWYGMFIFSIFMFLSLLWSQKIIQKTRFLFFAIVASLFIYIINPNKSFIWEKTDRHAEFINNYGNYLSYGEAAKILALPGDTLFVDGFDELIHWQANIPSPYKYSWYTSVMPHVPLYSKARLEMFKTNPPDIYYGNCPKEKADVRLIPKEYKSLYINLYAYGGPTCLYIKKDNLNKISKDQWQKAAEFGFHLKK